MNIPQYSTEQFKGTERIITSDIKTQAGDNEYIASKLFIAGLNGYKGEGSDSVRIGVMHAEMGFSKAVDNSVHRIYLLRAILRELRKRVHRRIEYDCGILFDKAEPCDGIQGITFV